MGTRFVFLGPPGAGKGTQAALISQALGVPAIATGGIFRDAIARGTQIGKQIGQFVNSGMLVPDKLTNAIVAERLKQKDCKKGFILDGYPRSLTQAKALDTYLLKVRSPIDRVLYFKVEAPVVIERMGKRRVCSQCAATYNLVSQSPKTEGLCDKCGGALVTRSDDTPEAIRKRLTVYEQTTKPLLDDYGKKNILDVVNASASVEAVARQVQGLCLGTS
ncbi:MAG: adenylate kinase [Elusimicrobia bacterium RIFCSPLOWO2_01_FULL_59_12]|nr:MAG: adenylate kinase [Elusimicrobia bacterium RIFCSPLOWO2_01_FULL_59_12]